MTRIETLKSHVGRRTFLAAAALVLTAGAAGAHVNVRPPPVDLTVIDRATGQQLPVWPHDGRLFVPGQPGARYSLRVTNRTWGRVLVVMSVDGVNIYTGETAGYDQSGYVLGPQQSYDVTGWRKSTSEVAAFSFAPLPQSYAARTGRPGDVGVIGMAVFQEKLPEPPPVVQGLAVPAPMSVPAPPPRASAEEVTVTGSRIARRDSNAGVPEEKLGTAHGARERSDIRLVSFERSTRNPVSLEQIEYDTYANLVARGVIPVGPSEERRPRPFPIQPRGGGFVPDPPYSG